MLAAIREKLKNAKLPPGISGAALSFIITGIMAMAFIGFSGIFTIQ
jgi:Na+-transporting NADH:ubiquinone oxidoreductase subunit E